MDTASQLKRLHTALAANGVSASELPASVDEATDKLLGMGRKRKQPEQTFAGTIRDAVEARVEERLKTLPLNLLRAMRSELEPSFVQPPTPSILTDKAIRWRVCFLTAKSPPPTVWLSPTRPLLVRLEKRVLSSLKCGTHRRSRARTDRLLASALSCVLANKRQGRFWLHPRAVSSATVTAAVASRAAVVIVVAAFRAEPVARPEQLG